MGQGMVRKQVYISQEQHLKRIAKQRGCTEAQLIRDSLQKTLENEEERLALWAKEMERMRRVSEEAERLRKQGLAGSGRTWTRDELYDRPKRYYAD